MNSKNFKHLTKCDFCQYKTVSGCTVSPNSYNCRKASDEFYAFLAAKKRAHK